MARKPPKNFPRLLYWFLALLFRIYYATLRVRIQDKHGVLCYLNDDQNSLTVAMTWHNRLCFFPLIMPKKEAHRSAAVISASSDGEYLARFIREFGVKAIRGSSSRKSLNVLRELQDPKHAQHHIIFTPDGPRGPCYHMSKGPVYAASKLKRPVVPIMINASTYWSLKSWDRFQIPKPFAKVTLIYGAMINIPSDLDDSQLEYYTEVLQNELSALCVD